MLASTATWPRRAQQVVVATGAVAVGAVAVSVFAIGFFGGTFSLADRATLGLLLAGLLLCGVLAGVWPAARLSPAARVAAGSLVALAAVTAASAGWTAAGNAYDEFTRALLYAVVVLAAYAVPRWSAARVLDGTAIGITVVALVALASRVSPDVVDVRAFPLLPGWETRLSYPVGYWNGLAILVAIAVPLLLRAAAAARAPWARGLAVAPLPALAAVIYLTSSRGGVVVTGVGVTAFVVLTPGRWSTIAAATAAAVGAAAGVAAVAGRHVLTEGPLGSPAAVAEGHGAAAWLAAACVGLGVVYALGAALVGPRWRVGRRPAVALVVAGFVAGVAFVAAADPVGRFQTFKAAPNFAHQTLQQHLLAAGGSGRWQFWTAALHEFERHPWVGGGAGSWAAWWAQHRDIGLVAHDAHSLYLETLAEVGVVGGLLLLLAFGAAVVTGIRRVRTSDGDDRVVVAAALAAFLAYAVGAGIDWMWELTIVSVVGLLLLGLLVGPATAPGVEELGAVRTPFLRRGAVALLVGAAFVAFAIPYLGERQLAASQSAADGGDWEGAVRAAASARALEPWASDPYLQLALVAEQAGDFRSATRWIGQAVARDRRDWRLWYVAARIETKAGNVRAARRNLQQVRRLDPAAIGAAPPQG